MKAAAAYLNRYIEVNSLKKGETLHAAGGFGPNYLTRIMSGQLKAPGADTLRKIAKHLGASWEIVGTLLDSDTYDIKDGKDAAEDPAGWLRKHASEEVATTILEEKKRTGSDRIADELEEMARKIRAGL